MAKFFKGISNSADVEHHFRTSHLTADIKSRSAKGGAITTVAQVCKFVLQTGSTVFLARLLTPQDYGLVGMVTAVTGFIALFKDLGLSMATVQRAEINHRQVSTLFWINIAASFFLAVLTIVFAPVVASFYSEPRLVSIMLVLACGFIFNGLGVQHQALLNRQMRYGALAITDIVTMTIATAAAVVAAWLGAGYWALVILTLLKASFNTVGDWLMCGWRPGIPSWGPDIRSMLAFGSNLTGFQIVNYFARNSDNVLIGRFWGPQQLGLYVKAYQLLLLPLTQINGPIRAVAVPTLSRLADSPERYRRVYLRILEKITILTLPSVAFLLATSDWLIVLFLGPQWSDASRIFMWLSFAALVQPVGYTTGWLFISQGRTQHMFQWGLMGSAISVVSIVAGLPWGATGVAAVYSLVTLFISGPVLFWFVSRTGPIRMGDFYRTMAPSVFAALCALLGLFAFRYWVEVSNPAVGLAVAIVITVGVTLSALALLPAGRQALKDFKGLFILLKKPSKKKSA